MRGIMVAVSSRLMGDGRDTSVVEMLGRGVETVATRSLMQRERISIYAVVEAPFILAFHVGF